MQSRYLEITYWEGRAVAAYLYLPRREGDRSVRCVERDHGMVVDFAEDGRPIGIELTAPGEVTTDVLNAVLESIHQSPMTHKELSPLAA